MARTLEPQPTAPVENTRIADMKPDPEVDRLVARIFAAFVTRVVINVTLIAFVAAYVVSRTHMAAHIAIAVLSASVYGAMLPFWRGLARLFKQLKTLGKQKIEQKKYMQAAQLLCHFHRRGNMGLDTDGEAHYLLTRAFIGTGELDKAQQMADWVQQYRKTDWAAKAVEALAAARRRQAKTEGRAAK